MPRSPLHVGGLVAIFVGALLLSLGLGRAGEEAAPAALRSMLSPSASASSPSPSHSEADTTTGLRLSVAAIDLDTSLRSVGVGASGAISPPAGQARWVRGFGRAEPGNVGTAVVAGHVVSSGGPDVFSHLSSVRVGSKVVVTTGSASRTYVVTRAAVVKKSALTHDDDVWGQNTSKRRIVLITCDDELGYRSDGHRVANYVVVADAV